MLAFAVELCVRFMSDVFDEFRPYLSAYPLRETLAGYLTVGVEWSQAYMGLLRLFARAAYHGAPALTEPLVHPIATLLLNTVRDMLVQAAARGEIRADVDLEATARIVHALTVAVGDSQLLPYLNAYFQVIDEGMPAERVLEALLELVWRGIGNSQQKDKGG